MTKLLLFLFLMFGIGCNHQLYHPDGTNCAAVWKSECKYGSCRVELDFGRTFTTRGEEIKEGDTMCLQSDFHWKLKLK